MAASSRADRRFRRRNLTILPKKPCVREFPNGRSDGGRPQTAGLPSGGLRFPPRLSRQTRPHQQGKSFEWAKPLPDRSTAIETLVRTNGHRRQQAFHSSIANSPFNAHDFGLPQCYQCNRSWVTVTSSVGDPAENPRHYAAQYRWSSRKKEGLQPRATVPIVVPADKPYKKQD